MFPGIGGCAEVVQDLVRGFSGSGEHYPLCNGAHGCKGKFSSLVMFWLSVRLGSAKTHLNCKTDILNIYSRVDSHYGELPLPFILAAIVDVLVIIA